MTPSPDNLQLTDEEKDLCLSCESGAHSYCLSCWSQNAVAKVGDGGFDHLPCPAYKCGECAPLCWAPVLLQDLENTKTGVMEVGIRPSGGPHEEHKLLSGFMQSRTRRFVDMFHASHYCPITGCDKVILVNLRQSSRSDLNFGTEPIPQTVTCSAGHATCLACKEDAHAPCSCDEHASGRQGEKSKRVPSVGDGSSIGGAGEIAAKLCLMPTPKSAPGAAPRSRRTRATIT